MRYKDDDSIRTHLDNLLRAARDQLNVVADEVRNSAVRIRGRIDSRQIERERRKLFETIFETIGERTYCLYDIGRRQLPDKLRNTFDKINLMTGRVIEDDRFKTAIERADEAVREVLVEAGDAIERSTRKLQKKKENND